ncbi:MAG: hypothetical protein WBE72_21220 [Terracidiphilus sp.]
MNMKSFRLMFAGFKRPAAACALLVLLVSPLGGQEERSSAAKGINTLAAPVPTPLLNGKKAFISYELGDVTAFPSSYSGGPERAYNEFFAGMKAWGRFELVMDPKDADVVFGIRFVDSPGLAAPQIRVGIADAQTQVALWGFVEQVDPALLKKHRDAAFSAAVQLLITDVQNLLTPGAAAAKAPGKTRLSDEAR